MVFIALLLVNYDTRHRRRKYGLPFKKKKKKKNKLSFRIEKKSQKRGVFKSQNPEAN